MNERFNDLARAVDNFTATKSATAISFVVVLVWLALGPSMHYGNTWQLIIGSISSVFTFVMVFILANSQKRNTDAIQAKLDALIVANDKADNRMIRLESLTQEEAASVHRDVVANADTGR